MDRKDFLTAIGMGAASVAVFNCIGCAKGSTGSPSTPAPTNVNFTLDLTTAANAALTNNGGYIYNNGVIVARTTTGAYIAVSQTCRHESTSVIYRANQNQFYCQRHGATYSETGVSAGIITNLPLTKYNTQLTGTNLRIFS
ncbi:MAG: Rieske 2Fe-2S domain-containing protein [Bacteroidetes bacterium]|nr:Rieske 2Fe-2S domain-containing protein [Bacteroidota bacterium]MBU1373113.1 Rieske 2Fe-2S domain-containing protein [Bacteroidota bacterium]MBU1484295.1 Rieske 2Fe-2S domain-containing protein [Bacteroidota bacterium]MBU1760258.1 Rieske 2Fe-2S domain-containing protein [Bacteroidota bacterium]MBU2045788.1 Rieske 2Fe-2S domain-containing protein [Bacteroidota bacterium]